MVHLHRPRVCGRVQAATSGEARCTSVVPAVRLWSQVEVALDIVGRPTLASSVTLNVPDDLMARRWQQALHYGCKALPVSSSSPVPGLASSYVCICPSTKASSVGQSRK